MYLSSMNFEANDFISSVYVGNEDTHARKFFVNGILPAREDSCAPGPGFVLNVFEGAPKETGLIYSKNAFGDLHVDKNEQIGTTYVAKLFLERENYQRVIDTLSPFNPEVHFITGYLNFPPNSSKIVQADRIEFIEVYGCGFSLNLLASNANFL
jgi:hypothetical protein